MPGPRLAAGLLVSLLLRRVAELGGNAAVLTRGDDTAGSILVQLAERGVAGVLLERQLGSSGTYRWLPAGPEDAGERDAYLARRRRSDPDLWVVELDVADGQALLEEVAA